MLRYVYSTDQKLTDKDMEKVAKRIEKTYPEGSETIMTLAKIYMEKGEQRGIEKGKAEGKEEGKIEGKIEGKRERNIEIVKNLLSLDVSIEKIVKATGLSEEDIERLQTK